MYGSLGAIGMGLGSFFGSPCRVMYNEVLVGFRGMGLKGLSDQQKGTGLFLPGSIWLLSVGGKHIKPRYLHVDRAAELQLLPFLVQELERVRQ